MQIRKAKIEDAKGIVETHYDAIHNTAKMDYDQKALDAWHEGVTQSRIEQMKQILVNEKEEIFVCDDNGKIVGFSSIKHDTNELRAVYVRTSYGNKSVGSKLIQALEERASELNLSHIQLHSSITAQRFYMKHGYKSLRKGFHTLSNGKKNFNSKIK